MEGWCIMLASSVFSTILLRIWLQLYQLPGYEILFINLNFLSYTKKFLVEPKIKACTSRIWFLFLVFRIKILLGFRLVFQILSLLAFSSVPGYPGFARTLLHFESDE